MDNHVAFTKRRLEALPVPKTRVTYFYDSQVRGLRLGVHPSGRRTFSLYRKFRRRPTTYPLGEFPHVSVDQARQQAGEKIAAMGRGVNPRDDLRGSANPTLGDFFERYIQEHLDGKPESQRGARQTFDRYLARWKGRLLADVTRADVERLHREVAKPVIVEDPETKQRRQRRGPVSANRLLALISGVFSKARDWGLLHGDNPARGVQKFQEHSRTRLLGRNGEFIAFCKALNAERDEDLRLYLKLRLYNGVRERNILAMRWENLQLDRCTWQIGVTKNGDPLVVPLSNPVLDELRQRARVSDWVFPGRTRGGHLHTLNKRWRAFRAALGGDFCDLQLRDLRRTFGSRALAASVPMDVIAQMMGHKPGSKVTASVYALADEELKREAITATTQKMLAEAKGRKPVPSRRNLQKRLTEASA